jgi:hypothetical protein
MPIYQKINRIMKELHGVPKDSVNSHKKYQYQGYDAVNAALRPLFAQHGVVRVANALKLDVLEHGTIQVMVQVCYVDIEDGTELVVPMVSLQPSQTSQKSVEAQQVGQAISYAVKNVELKLFALTGNQDSDDVDVERAAIQSETSTRYPRASLTGDITDNGVGVATFTSGAQARFSELAKMFRGATTEAEVKAIEANVKAEWNDLKDLPGAREGLAGARNAALQRVAGK